MVEIQPRNLLKCLTIFAPHSNDQDQGAELPGANQTHNSGAYHWGSDWTWRDVVGRGWRGIFLFSVYRRTRFSAPLALTSGFFFGPMGEYCELALPSPLFNEPPRNCRDFLGAFPTVDRRNPAPLGNHGEQLFVGIYRRIIILGFLGWCRISSIHSMCHLHPRSSLPALGT